MSELYFYVSSFLFVFYCGGGFLKKNKESKIKNEMKREFNINSIVLTLEQKHDNIVLEMYS